MSIEKKQQEIISEFAIFDNWMKKYEHIIQLGKDLPLIAPEKKTDETLKDWFITKSSPNKSNTAKREVVE